MKTRLKKSPDLKNKTQTAASSPASSPGVTASKGKSGCACGGGCPKCKKNKPKILTMSTPGDSYEREAHKVADDLVKQPRRSEAKPATSSPRRFSRSQGGRPLDDSTRSSMEQGLGGDLGNVRIHDNARAAKMAGSLNAAAFTHGSDIFFNSGRYQPQQPAGKQLLAHELVHAAQQGAVPLSADSPVKARRSGLPDLFRQELNVSQIFSDIQAGMDTHEDLYSWLHVLGQQTGTVGFAAAAGAAPTATGTGGTGTTPQVSSHGVPLSSDAIKGFFFPSYDRHTDQRALIIGGFHGDERPGYEMVEALIRELQSGGRHLAFHTLIIPRVNAGAIEDDLAGVTSYDRRCNRQLVDLNRNFPVPGASHSSADCVNTATAPVQPETQAVMDVIRDFQPHRILTAHAISTASEAGIFADPNTHPTAVQLACELAGRLQHQSDRQHNQLTATSCNAVYAGDTAGRLPRGGSLGRYGPTGGLPGVNVPVITVEAPEYHSLGTGTGARTTDAFLQPLLAFIDGSTGANNIDATIVRDIEAFSLADRRLFLTGRLPLTNAIYTRIERRIQEQVNALNALRPTSPVRPVRVVSRQRAFTDPIPRATPQSQIVFDKFLLHGSKSSGWDSLPDSWFNGPGRSGGVDRARWLAEPTASRMDIILRFSAVPGASRHHWGTDVDFHSTSDSFWASSRGRNLATWLQTNAPRVGFLKTYTAGRSGGHNEEAWHFSYEPIAGPLRQMHNRDVRLTQDIVDHIIVDWSARASSAGLTLPADLRSGLLLLNLSEYVDTIGPGL